VTPLLEQFLSEAKDLLESAGAGLLVLERQPGDAETVNAVFRALHTLKGGSGLFPFGALTALLHAAEDALDAIRRGDLALTAALTDDLLACVDTSTRWLDEVAERETLPGTAESEGRVLGQRVRAYLGGAPPAAAEHGGHAEVAVEAIDPALQPFAEGIAASGKAPLLVQYAPAEDCFFQGDDPLFTMRNLPGLAWFVAHDPPGGFSSLAELDPYKCRFTFEAVSSAPEAELTKYLAYVADHVTISTIVVAPATDEAEAFRSVLRDQRDALAMAAEGEERTRRLADVVTVAANALRFMRRSERLDDLEKASAASDAAAVLRILDELLIGTAAPSGGAGAAAASAASHARTAPTVKVDQAKIDLVMNLVGELVVAKNGLPYLARRADDVMARAITEQYAVMHRIADALQTAVMQMRMMPIGGALQRFPRLVRDLARQLDKEVEIVVTGEETETDKTIIERLGEPLTHLVRNSLDHGIELPAEREKAGKPRVGKLTLAARHDGDSVVLDIADDGRGIDPARIKTKAVERGVLDAAAAARISDEDTLQLIFAPGFSTAEKITDVSGRGVGMDAVRRDIESLGGRVTILNRPGQGSTMRLTLPVTMAVSRVLTVRVGDERYGVPVEKVVGVVRVGLNELTTIRHDRVFVWRGKLLPVLDLGSVLGAGAVSAGARGELAILVVEAAGQTVALAVDAFEADVDVVLKPLQGILAECRGFAGTAILGDGRALLVLDPEEVVAWELVSKKAA